MPLPVLDYWKIPCSLKVGGRQTRVNLQTRDLATAKRKRDADNAKLLKADRDKLNLTLRECVKDYIKSKSQPVAMTRPRVSDTYVPHPLFAEDGPGGYGYSWNELKNKRPRRLDKEF